MGLPNGSDQTASTSGDITTDPVLRRSGGDSVHLRASNATNDYLHPESVTKPEPVPEPIAVKLAELYSEYVKPERFFQWVYEQEHLKRELAKQQQELELQRQHNIACAKLHEQLDGWDGNQFVKQ